MDKLSQISLENTVTVKIDYQLNQQLLVKNFGIIMDCLKDLKTQQDKHSSEINNMAGLKEMFDKFREQLRVKEEKQKQRENSNNNSENSNGKSNTNSNDNSNDNSSLIDKAALESLQNQIDALKDRMTKNQASTHDNTKDINILLKDMKDAKQEIQNLKKQLLNVNSGRSNSQHGDKNLSKNDNLNQDILNNLNQQSQKHQESLQKLIKEMQDTKKHLKSLQRDVDDLKNIQQQALEDKKLEESASNNNSNNDGALLGGNFDQKALSDLMKKVDFLTKKSQNMQSQLLNNARCISQLGETTEKNSQDIESLKNFVDGINSEIDKIKNFLDQLQKALGNSNGNNNKNSDNSQLLNEIEKLKEKYQKLLKIINSMKQSKTSLQKIDNNNNGGDTDRLPGSNKNISKLSQDRSFRKRSQSVDMNGKIRELTERIKVLQKMLSGDDNPQKLPSIGWKRATQTGYNGQKSHKKEMSEMKNDLQIWIRSYLENMNKNNGGNLTDLELKMQQMKNILLRKADHEGMKKGLAFLEGKITQLYLFLTQPESEDAMIVRKGFNCLSCSKKVQNLRGKLGPRMNWDNLNNTHTNIQTPPKTGFPKYHDSNERQSL